MKAMILAAGMGTRLRPLTDHIPKPLVKFKGIPLLERIIYKLINIGVDSIVVNVHYLADQVIEYLSSKDFFDGKIVVSDETHRLMDTGGGVLKAEKFLNDGQPFILHNVDVYTDLDIKALYQFHKDNNALITIAVKKRPTSRCLLFNVHGQLAGWQHNQTGEQKIIREYSESLEDFGNSCIYVIDPEFFNLVNDTEPVSLTDIYLELAKKQEIMAYVHNEDYWYNLGLYETFRNAEKVLSD